MTCQYCAIPIGAHTFEPCRIGCQCGHKVLLMRMKSRHEGIVAGEHVFSIRPFACPKCGFERQYLLADCEDGIAAPGWPVREEAHDNRRKQELK